MAVLIFLLIFGISYCETLNIAAAANVQYALSEIVKSFQKKHPDIKVITTVSSSGKLTSQIERGAPYDLFLSADMKYPQYLHKKGKAVSKPVVYAEGSLVLWSMKNINIEKGVNVLLDSKVKKISLPNPKNAPYGREAVKVLKYYGLYEKVKSKLVYGESVSQSTQYIYKKLVDVGFTSKSVVLSPKMKGKGKWISISTEAYSPIKQGVVILTDKTSAKLFLKFILSEEGKNILKKYGYHVK